MPHLPINREEAFKRGWDDLDIIFVTGDAYIDHPAFGVPLLARLLESRGYRIGIISQPDWRSREQFAVFGRPRLFFAVAAGAMDSMVAHYTPARKLRRDDAYTPGNRHGARPNRATIVYTSRLKECFKDVPVIIGGIEASLRRFAHYDYWEDKVRRSLLFDAKADLLVYGMGERPLLELAERVRRGERVGSIRDIRGTAVSVGSDEIQVILSSACEIPPFEEVVQNRRAFADAYRLASGEQNPFCGRIVVQRHSDRYLVCNPPPMPLTEREMDEIYALPFEKTPHPSYQDPIPAYDQIKASITTHRGCAGGCAFCSLAHHQGKFVQSRSEASIVQEIERLVGYKWFTGFITDVGGPTANMYGMSCGSRTHFFECRRPSCLYPVICRHLNAADKKAVALLRRIRKIRGVRQAVVASGIRYDLLPLQREYFRDLLAHHIGGLLKVAPEHLVDSVTMKMQKPSGTIFFSFREHFRTESHRLGKSQYIVAYMMSGHPGCTLSDMVDVAITLKQLGIKVEQVQDFTPTPGTLSTCMYFTGIDPFSGEEVYIPTGEREKRLQKALLLYHLSTMQPLVKEALKKAGRMEVAGALLVNRGNSQEKNSTKSPSRKCSGVKYPFEKAPVKKT